MRPTEKRPEWKTLENWIHIDLYWSKKLIHTFGYEESDLYHQVKFGEISDFQYQHQYYQGIVAIDDCPVETGGLIVVPGFHSIIDEWSKANQELSANQIISCSCDVIDKNDALRDYAQKIPIKKNTLVIWDGRLAHANFPNTGSKPRFIQYIKMNAVGKNIKSQIKPMFPTEQSLTEYAERTFEFTDLGRKLFGFEPW